ncbi:MAG: proline dehydrogenase family protein [Bacteroidia bacterium]
METLNFNNTEIAFKAKSDGELRNSHFLFKAIGYNWLVQIGPAMVNACFAIHLPIKGIIKATVFKQFCGGESINDCELAMNTMYKHGVGTILDYSVEGEEEESEFEETAEEIIRTIKKAAGDKRIPFSVFKVTGVMRFGLLESLNDGKTPNEAEANELAKAKARIEKICQTAYDLNVRIFIDAEESWIQNTIDSIAEEMMLKYNSQKAIVYNTLQFYRHDRLAYLKEAFKRAEAANYHYGIKLVRGAYMEKESERAQQMAYKNPIQPSKAATDKDYDLALEFCIDNIAKMAICAGSHNENSSQLLVSLMEKKALSKNDERVYFSQLYGMSDHLSYNLAHNGYNVAKYLPYGPVKSVLPYLFRRAQENTSVQGQAGRELSLIEKEIKRRKQKS